MHLHGGGGQQDQSLSALLQPLHELQQAVWPRFVARSGPAPSGVVSFVQDDQIPRFGLQQFGHAIPAAHQVAGNQHTGFLMPLLPGNQALRVALQGGAGIPAQPLAVVNRPVEVELLAQFDLPLRQHGLGNQHQHPLGPTGQPSLPQQQPGLNRLTKPNLVGQQIRPGPSVDNPSGMGFLMRPRRHPR